MPPVVKTGIAVAMGALVGVTICLILGDWNLHIVAVATLLGLLLWLNRRFLIPAILLDPFDRTPDSR